MRKIMKIEAIQMKVKQFGCKTSNLAINKKHKIDMILKITTNRI
jgi:hypothetical protein